MFSLFPFHQSNNFIFDALLPAIVRTTTKIVGFSIFLADIHHVDTHLQPTHVCHKASAYGSRTNYFYKFNFNSRHVVARFGSVYFFCVSRKFEFDEKEATKSENKKKVRILGVWTLGNVCVQFSVCSVCVWSDDRWLIWKLFFCQCHLAPATSSVAYLCCLDVAPVHLPSSVDWKISFDWNSLLIVFALFDQLHSFGQWRPHIAYAVRCFCFRHCEF